MRIRLALIIIVVSFFLCQPAAAAPAESQEVSDDIQANLAYLLSFVGSSQGARDQFDPQRIHRLLEFVAATKPDGAMYHAGKLNGGPSAYHDFGIRKNLRDILRITYDANIPAVFTSPSSVRMTHWKEVEGKSQPLPLFWEELRHLDAPLIVTGVEHIVNTPDAHSGTYYSYDLQRTMILTRYRGKNVFISMSKQPQCSSVGKKGLVIGPDQNWEYLYSGKTGVGMSGLGWVRSYMYDSNAVVIYYESDPGKPLTRFAVFKWIKAGWKEINFVKPSHIHAGLLRFAKDFKTILENPDLPDPEILARSCTSIRGLSDQELRQVVQEHLASVEQLCRSEDLLSDAATEKLLKNQRYLNNMTRKEMENLATLLYLKQLLGRGQQQRLTSLPVSTPLPR